MADTNLAMPGNPRYQPSELIPFWGYDRLFGWLAAVEVATMKALADIGVIPSDDIALLTDEVVDSLHAITTTEVDAREKKVTKHDVRAWVQLAQERLPLKLRRWLHVPLTSYDALDTARVLQFASAHQTVVSPMIHRLVAILAHKVEEYKGTLQIGRTHGQHALPITVGFWLATILNRVITNASQMDRFADGLVGKISGAVGAYNAQQGLGFTGGKRGDFEARVLARLDLQPAPISTQILPPEPLTYFLFATTLLSAALGQLGRDVRHLMRTEIGEIGEPFEEGQVGSSTMAHKRNPINAENTEGMWLRTKNAFGLVLETLISEHQRDLVGSSLARDFPIPVINVVHQMNTLLRGSAERKSYIERLSVDMGACRRNFAMQADVILAEPIYIALQMAGYEGDAHELVNHKAMPLVAQGRVSNLMGAVELLAEEGQEHLRQVVSAIPSEVATLLRSPENYTGLAEESASRICVVADEYISQGPWQRPSVA